MTIRYFHLNLVHRKLIRKKKAICQVKNLSKETFYALKFSRNNAIEIIKYAFEKLSHSYILLGKLKIDSLEACFGQYRQMSRGNYISCIQVLKVECKLKILT